MKEASLLLLLVLALALPVRAQEHTHTVRAGDSLAKLMWTYGVSGEAILRANGLRSAQLPIGRTLVIPGDVIPPRAEPVATPEKPVTRAEPVLHAETTPPPPPPTEESLPPRSRDFSAAIALPAGENVHYNGRWVPPGESSAWVMDCSNTTRWLYRDVRGLDLPRTASDQYEWLRSRHRLWRVNPNSRSLQRRLQPGDLLFWEDTYRPVRRPPVTHVMLYLGTNEDGRMMMAGSQGASGPDIYEFRPAKKMGGYRFFFFFHRDGRFVAYGRP